MQNESPQEFPWGSMEWLIDDAIQPGAGLSVARMTLAPGRQAEAHRHETCNEVVQLLAGEIEQDIAGQRHRLRAGDCVFIPAGAAHVARNSGRQKAVLLLCYSSGKRDYQPA